MTAHEIQQDAIYAEAYSAAEKAFNKKYKRLLEASSKFLNQYESSFGEPDDDTQDTMGFFKLKNILHEQTK